MANDAPLLIDVTRLIWRRWRGRYPTGIDRVCLAYLRHFGQSSQAVVHHERFRRILNREASQQLFQLLQEPESHFRPKLVTGALRNLSRLNSRAEGRLYLNVGHTGLNSAGFRRWVQHADVRPVYLIHDLIPITHPAFCRPGETEKHRQRMRTALTTATGIIGNSKSTLDDLSTFASIENLPSPPSITAWLGADPVPDVIEMESDDRPTFLVVGTIEARKNHLLLLQIWSELIEQLGERAPRLTIIGHRGWEAEDVFEQLDFNSKLKGHVVEINNSSDRELAAHLGSARALLFPSFIEGYGLPLIEALRARVPVIASDLPVFREIAGDVPTYLSPHDRKAWKDAIVEFARPESPVRKAQLERVKLFREPDWDRHFHIVESWLASFN